MRAFNLAFNEHQLQVIDAALLEMPYRIAAPLIAHINTQIQRQFDQRADDAPPSGQTTPPDQFAGS